MGMKSAEALEVSPEELPTYLMAHHAVYLDLDGANYYLTDVNDSYWRVQDVAKLNEKGHYTDCSELVSTVREFIDLPFGPAGITVGEACAQGTLYASEKPE
ncbi:CDP-alcohol phosphatidyltransferase [Eggerthellaceae bacterium zg-1084]|uniref:CDP-alcohol phosphatidyltransferase n=1 Tax=Berryella wangjianweii TaxID=2734634 RepID=A0A6M8IZI9_9ACTN|nr:CDP-alcohol phosphatidyltransferase [Berryella wangjianweii]NPD30474.1 CDP-alcohol phosphatidyltransferase [Berryella wangjianweii]QKF07140.1 CDP-alcohol phosphatidyltransferase [Berryella wangjianweii]